MSIDRGINEKLCSLESLSSGHGQINSGLRRLAVCFSFGYVARNFSKNFAEISCCVRIDGTFTSNWTAFEQLNNQFGWRRFVRFSIYGNWLLYDSLYAHFFGSFFRFFTSFQCLQSRSVVVVVFSFLLSGIKWTKQWRKTKKARGRKKDDVDEEASIKRREERINNIIWILSRSFSPSFLYDVYNDDDTIVVFESHKHLGLEPTGSLFSSYEIQARSAEKWVFCQNAMIHKLIFISLDISGRRIAQKSFFRKNWIFHSLPSTEIAHWILHIH